MFTGLWPHELGSRWMHPMRGDVPTLAEYLGSSGYATAGFVGNTFYCAYDSGLDRGFTHYRDYPSWASALPDRLLDLGFNAVESMTPALASSMAAARRSPGSRSVSGRSSCPSGRTRGWSIGSSSAGWTRRREPRRPFFAFLNYWTPMPRTLPPGREYRFGRPPATDADFLFLTDGLVARGQDEALPVGAGDGDGRLR